MVIGGNSSAAADHGIARAKND